MTEKLTFILFASTVSSILMNPIVIIVAVLVLAVVILVTALFLLRNSGKNKAAKADRGAQASDWQRQGQQANAPGAWNQPGAQADWAQQQQPGAWGAQSPSPQQPAEWGATPSSTPSAGAGMGGNQPSWGQDATLRPQKSAQDPWGQPQAASQQQGASPWGMQGSSPSQQQAPTGYGGSGSGQSWQQSGQPAASKDPWGQAAQSQPAAWGQQPFQQPPSSPPPPAAGNAGIPSWQQGPAQGQGFGAPGIQPDAAPMFGANDNDKTMLRPSGPQGALGTVRVEEGKEPGRVYEVRKDELSIGRSRESDIFLEDLAVSRLHAKIVNLGNGNYALKDEGSANGTKVNGQLVNKYQTYPLQEGDKIQLGQTVLVFARR